MKLNKPLSKFQKIAIAVIGGSMAVFSLLVIIFGPNEPIIDRAALTEQVRQEKLDYIQVRTTTENREILESSLIIDAFEQGKVVVKESADPSAIDIEIEVNKLLGL